MAWFIKIISWLKFNYLPSHSRCYLTRRHIQRLAYFIHAEKPEIGLCAAMDEAYRVYGWVKTLEKEDNNEDAANFQRSNSK